MTTGPAWVSPALLRAECVAVEDPPKWLLPGVHLRVFPSPLIGFPICPFTVWRAGAAYLHSRPLPPLLADGSALFTGVGEQALVVGAAGRGGRTVSVVDQAGRLGPSCSGPYPFVARVPLPGLRYDGPRSDLNVAVYGDGPEVDGSGTVLETPSWLFVSPQDQAPLDAIGAPLPDTVWWCGADSGRYLSADLDYRVYKGVPGDAPQYNPAPDDPKERAASSARHLEADIRRLWTQPADATPPSAAALTTRPLPGTGDAREMAVDTDLSVALWASTADPAVARWWGFATTLPVSPKDLVNVDRATCFAVAALFAIEPTERNTPLLNLLPDPADPMEQAFTEALYKAHESVALPDRAKDLEASGHRLVSLWTIAVATPPPDPPEAPEVDAPAGQTRWNPAPEADGDPDGTWTARLAVRNTLGGPLAVRREPDVWLNPDVDDSGRWRQPIIAPSAGPGTGAVSVTDTKCPGGSAGWQVATADLWGQWSPFGDSGDVGPPARPWPPAPGVVLDYAPADPPPTGATAASPGTVTVRATVSAPAAGGAPVGTVEARLTAASGWFPLADRGNGNWTAATPAPPTTPGTSLNVNCTVVVHHSGGPDTSTTAALTVHDPRPYAKELLSEVILFSGDRRPDGYAELDIWTTRPTGAPAGTGWRLYAGEEQASRTGGAAEQPRWQRAEPFRADTVAGRTPMARVTDAMVTEAGGRLRIRCRLPGRLESLRALQLVPVGASGLEAPRDRRGCCVVAVPLTDAPPAPRIGCVLDPDGVTVRLTVSVDFPGVRPAGEGLAPPIARRVGDGASANTAVPLVQVRRSAAGGAPATWPMLGSVTMRPTPPTNPADGWRWTGEFTDRLPSGVPAWAPLAYVCQAAWPAEPTYRPGSTPIPGAFSPTWGPTATTARQGIWSASSAACAMAAPRLLPPVVPRYTAHGDGTASLAITVPAIHPAAPPWTLTATAPAPDPATPPPSASVEGLGPELRLDDLPGHPPPEAWLVALTTPDGRTLPMVTGAAPP
ncbi:hypothetical protein ACFVIY_03705 [Streptomyces sp. NPDC127166]|uniref:hypothetical protein n=1 Tax=Streptomyces sp. NPDC127166 TaxID=3345380 RepID=UPI0036283293